jgi:TusA-related sulfurtransferase
MQERDTTGTPVDSLDLRGVECPDNANRALFALEIMDEGEVLELRLSEGEPADSLLETMRFEGHGVSERERGGGTLVVWIERGEDL